MDYKVVFGVEPEGGLTVNVPALSDCICGETLEESEEMAQEAIELYLESLREYGEPVKELVK